MWEMDFYLGLELVYLRPNLQHAQPEIVKLGLCPVGTPKQILLQRVKQYVGC